MKIKHQAWFLALSLTLGISTLPTVAQSCSSGGAGLIYNSEDGKYYPVPSADGRVIYRSVDGVLYPVARYGRCHYYFHHKHHRYVCRHSVVTVECQTRPAHWLDSQWYPSSNVCWYKVRHHR